MSADRREHTFKTYTDDEINVYPFDVWAWNCPVEGCRCNGTAVSRAEAINAARNHVKDYHHDD